MVLEGRMRTLGEAQLRTILQAGLVMVVPFDAAMYELASGAFLRFGKGRGHPARLNFGDCLAYAVARSHAVPLLFKGDDFVHTDLEPAHRQRP